MNLIQKSAFIYLRRNLSVPTFYCSCKFNGVINKKDNQISTIKITNNYSTLSAKSCHFNATVSTYLNQYKFAHTLNTEIDSQKENAEKSETRFLLKGLPYNVTNDEITNLFDGINLSSITIEEKITRPGFRTGRGVICVDDEDVDKVMEKNKSYIGNRYIEILKLAKLQETTNNTSDDYDIVLRGLPFHASLSDVQSFLKEIDVVNVKFTTNRDGLVSGTALVKVSSDLDIDKALKLHRCYMDKRYIEVSRYMKRNTSSPDLENSLLLLGLPYQVTEDQIREFFKGIDLISVDIHYFRSGLRSGTATVTVANKEDFNEALKKNKEFIGERYINIKPKGITSS